MQYHIILDCIITAPNGIIRIKLFYDFMNINKNTDCSAVYELKIDQIKILENRSLINLIEMNYQRWEENTQSFCDCD